MGANCTPPSDDDATQAPEAMNLPIPGGDFRRLSVNSLLSSPGESVSQEERLREATGSYLRLDTKTEQSRTTTYYGMDCGFLDLDIGKNDDTNALSGSSPKLNRNELNFDSSEDEEQPVEFGFGFHAVDFEPDSGGYYDKPVIVSIPCSLEPLPPKLTKNPMNLLVCSHAESRSVETMA